MIPCVHNRVIKQLFNAIFSHPLISHNRCVIDIIYTSKHYTMKGAFYMDGCGCVFSENFAEHIGKFMGQTVTIYTTSGGASGCGITGVVIACNPCFVRVVTCLGPAPCCALGSDCNTCCCPTFCGGFRGRHGCVSTVGSVADIPVDRIASFIHHAI